MANEFNSTVSSLMNGMDSFLTTKTVVGEPTKVGDTIILPLADVSFGLGAGSFSGDNKDKSCGGMGGKISPSAVLVIHNGQTKLVNIKNQETLTKVLDMVPDLIERFSSKKDSDVDDVAKAVEDVASEE